MSNSFRDRERHSGDRFRDKSGEEILQSMRDEFDQGNRTFFDPQWTEPSTLSSHFTRVSIRNRTLAYFSDDFVWPEEIFITQWSSDLFWTSRTLNLYTNNIISTLCPNFNACSAGRFAL